jgi:hypothetical protein
MKSNTSTAKIDFIKDLSIAEASIAGVSTGEIFFWIEKAHAGGLKSTTTVNKSLRDLTNAHSGEGLGRVAPEGSEWFFRRVIP